MQTEYCIRNSDKKAFFIGDEVTIKTNTLEGLTGVITHITCKGLYINNGGKKDKYFRADEIVKITQYK
ncbi:hypothetical protein SH1V18_03450 [Vallitalea longa]|uniref:Uncharacterized protein n=1 Tax=Vallitalea longa TaxID=2936439 RepID=A0A9W5Y779_9FIRM|nr:hypothetical protein [Vallitalea longa]GKX27865.1 hypothetical protein SH1V18_03450 [Vallitalea longa]